MYAGEPMIIPVRVTVTSPSIVARPQSVSTTRWSDSSTLLGFTSRCTMPARCAAHSAASTASPIRATSGGGSGPSSTMTWCSDRDGTYSMTIHGCGCLFTTS